MRSRRRRALRLAAVAAAFGVGALIAIPALDLLPATRVVPGPPARAAAAQEPTSGTATQPPAPGEPSQPDAAEPSAEPLVASLGPIGSTDRPVLIGAGVPPSRLMAEPGDPTAPNPSVLTGYVWPLAHPRLTLPFGPTPWGTRVVDGQLFHDGIDIATFCGDHVRAAHSGTVLAASRHFDNEIGWVGDLGPYYRRLDEKHAWNTLPIVVIIDDRNGYRSVYAHFERLAVHVGQVVKAGQLLGYEGATGHATGCHVHYDLFSPLETKTFGIEAGVARRLKTPKLEIARINPLLVLPPKPSAGSKASSSARSG
jgi:murein DD-endopeptidase MepM/ murein hydrolase activator NlpD